MFLQATASPTFRVAFSFASSPPSESLEKASHRTFYNPPREGGGELVHLGRVARDSV